MDLVLPAKSSILNSVEAMWALSGWKSSYISNFSGLIFESLEY